MRTKGMRTLLKDYRMSHGGSGGWVGQQSLQGGGSLESWPQKTNGPRLQLRIRLPPKTLHSRWCGLKIKLLSCSKKLSGYDSGHALEGRLKQLIKLLWEDKTAIHCDHKTMRGIWDTTLSCYKVECGGQFPRMNHNLADLRLLLLEAQMACVQQEELWSQCEEKVVKMKTSMSFS